MGSATWPPVDGSTVTPASASAAGSLSAADFSKLATVRAGDYVGDVVYGPEIDLAALSTDTVVIAARAGFYFVPFAGLWFTTVATGSASTPPTIIMGNNVTKNNICASQPSPGTASGHAAGAPARSTITLTTGIVVDTATAVKLDVTVAATGTTLVWRARPILIGIWIAA
jgi:hypothetical protein